MLHDYVQKKHPDWVAPMASIRFNDGLPGFSSWYSSALLTCPWNLRESFYELRSFTRKPHFASRPLPSKQSCAG
jgi:hypothetical protein